MNKTFILLALFSFSVISYCQNQEVIATSGGYSESGSVSVSWTIGEVVTETVSNGSTTLTQGFQQGTLIIETLLNSTQESAFQINAYPNPVANILNIELTKPETKFSYTLVDSKGTIIINGYFEESNNELDFSNLSKGSYFLIIDGIKSYKIIKN